MKTQCLLLALILIPVTVTADSKLLGAWVDKTNPQDYQYHFKKNNEFGYIFVNPFSDINELRILKGVWETGDQDATRKKSSGKDSCSVTIYAGNSECCFAYKFIGNNLILTIKHRSETFGSMCENRVLVRPGKK